MRMKRNQMVLRGCFLLMLSFGLVSCNQSNGLQTFASNIEQTAQIEVGSGDLGNGAGHITTNLQATNVRTTKTPTTKKQNEEQKKSEQPQKEEQKKKEDALQKRAEDFVSKMSLEDKVAQLFVVAPEGLIGGSTTVTAAKEKTKTAFEEIPVGGFVYFSNNLQNEEQVKTMLSDVKKISKDRVGLTAFTSVDEEGGSVARISGTGKFNIPAYPNMEEIGKTKDVQRANQIGKEMGIYLTNLGFNVDYAPVSDVLLNEKNTVIKKRAFSSDPKEVSEFCSAFLSGLQESKIVGAYKHFPGHGNTKEDSHKMSAYNSKTLEELKKEELLPYELAEKNQLKMIMVGHISLPNILGDDTPATLSKTMITDILRNEYGYQNLVITDAMQMKAISSQYSSAEGTIRAIEAGCDLILMPASLKESYQGVLHAVKSGRVSEERINQSVVRIVKLKLEME